MRRGRVFYRSLNLFGTDGLRQGKISFLWYAVVPPLGWWRKSSKTRAACTTDSHTALPWNHSHFVCAKNWFNRVVSKWRGSRYWTDIWSSAACPTIGVYYRKDIVLPKKLTVLSSRTMVTCMMSSACCMHRSSRNQNHTSKSSVCWQGKKKGWHE